MVSVMRRIRSSFASHQIPAMPHMLGSGREPFADRSAHFDAKINKYQPILDARNLSAGKGSNLPRRYLFKGKWATLVCTLWKRENNSRASARLKAKAMGHSGPSVLW